MELDGPDAARGTITLKQATSSWSEKGLTYSASTEIEASTNLYVHFDPMIGGGIGKRVSLEGTASPVLAGTLALSVRTYAGVPVLMIEHQLHCTKVPITAMDEGDLNVGVTVSQMLGGGRPSLIPVLMGVPHLVKVRHVLDGITAVKVLAPRHFAAITYAPTHVLMDANGLWAEFSTRAEWSRGADSDLTDQIEAIEAMVKKDQMIPSAPECGEPDAIKVHLAGFGFEQDLGLGEIITSLVDGAKKGTTGIENFLSTAGRTAINLSSGSALRKPLTNPLETIKCLGTLLQKCD